MARKALALDQSSTYKGDLGTGESNNKKIDDTLAELDQQIVIVEATPNTTTTVKFAPRAGRTISKIEMKRHTAIATGTCTVAVQDADSNSLLVGATIDATALTASFVEKTLTATTANLALAAGEPCKVIFVSDSGSTTGGPVVVLITYAAV